MLRAFALGEFRHRLAHDQRLEVIGLLMLGEGRLVLEDLVEEELWRLAGRRVDLERLHARLALGLWQELADDRLHGVDFVGFGLPEGGDDETILECVKIGHGLLLWLTMAYISRRQR